MRALRPTLGSYKIVADGGWWPSISTMVLALVVVVVVVVVLVFFLFLLLFLLFFFLVLVQALMICLGLHFLPPHWNALHYGVDLFDLCVIHVSSCTTQPELQSTPGGKLLTRLNQHCFSRDVFEVQSCDTKRVVLKRSVFARIPKIQ